MTLVAHSPVAALHGGRRMASSAPSNERVRRWGRYAVTYLVATGVSEATLLTLYGLHLMAASVAAVAASVVGTVPSYVMSRYWIWRDADRRRPGRQAVAYWVVSLVSIGMSSLVTGLAAANAPAWRAAHLAVVGLAYIGTYGGLWVGKFAVYQRFLFRSWPGGAVTSPSPP